MEAEGRNVNYFACPVVRAKWSFLQVGKRLINLDSGYSRSESLAEWEQKSKEKIGA